MVDNNVKIIFKIGNFYFNLKYFVAIKTMQCCGWNFLYRTPNAKMLETWHQPRWDLPGRRGATRQDLGCPCEAWKCESLTVKVWRCESVKVKVWKCESESLKMWKFEIIFCTFRFPDHRPCVSSGSENLPPSKETAPQAKGAVVHDCVRAQGEQRQVHLQVWSWLCVVNDELISLI